MDNLYDRAYPRERREEFVKQKGVRKMLLALCYIRDDYLAAAAMACDQQPSGDRFWRDLHPSTIDLHGGCETAYVEMDDAQLCDQLLNSFEDSFSDGYKAARTVDQYLDARRDRERRQAA